MGFAADPTVVSQSSWGGLSSSQDATRTEVKNPASYGHHTGFLECILGRVGGQLHAESSPLNIVEILHIHV
jgi:hypothetical protein